MHEHALDAMLYAWLVMDEKKKEENKMEGIFLGKVDQTAFDPRRISLSFGTKHLDQHVEVRKELDYDCDYMLVKTNDVIINNDELLKLRDEVKRLTDECNEWKVRYSTVNNELFQKGLAYGTLETAYKNEKIAGEMLIKDRDALKEKVANLTGQKERLRDGAIYWNNRFTSVMTDFGKVLEANGVTFAVKNIDNDGNWDVVIDIPKLNEAKKKVEDLETKLAASKSNETYWRDRKEEEEDYHHYWHYTFDRAVKQAAEKGVYIAIAGKDDDCNAGIVVVENKKTADLESQVVQMEDANQRLRKRIGAADDELEAATKRGDYWKSKYDDLAEYWDNTYKDMVACEAKVGVKIEFKGDKSDSNAGKIHITNEKALGLAYELNNVRQKQNKKWQAMCDALKAKGVEVIYMGEEDGKPIVDVKIPAIDILRKDYVVRGQIISDLKKELEELKSKKVATCTLEAGADGGLKFIYTYMDGHNEPAHINCLCKNHVAVDAESLSNGTFPKCSSCARYMHNPSRWAHDWCRKPISKEGPGTIRKLSKEEAEGPACSDFKARKE